MNKPIYKYMATAKLNDGRTISLLADETGEHFGIKATCPLNFENHNFVGSASDEEIEKHRNMIFKITDTEIISRMALSGEALAQIFFMWDEINRQIAGNKGK